MVTEITKIEIISGKNNAFEAAVCQAAPTIAASKGCHGINLYRSIEHPNFYRLMVRWETKEHHVVDFVSSDAMPVVSTLIAPFFASEPLVEHVREVDLSDRENAA